MGRGKARGGEGEGDEDGGDELAEALGLNGPDSSGPGTTTDDGFFSGPARRAAAGPAGGGGGGAGEGDVMRGLDRCTAGRPAGPCRSTFQGGGWGPS
jgi:hypothetical protein